MAKVAAVAWFPRSHIHLFESHRGLDKIDLELDDIVYGESLSFTVREYGGYNGIRFTQDRSGLHYFVCEVPDDGLEATIQDYMRKMQSLLAEEILKVCHTVTYKQIVDDVMPLDFHVIVLSSSDLAPAGYEAREAGKLRVYWKPEDAYLDGTLTYVCGSDDDYLLEPLLYHAYTEVASDLLYSMMKALTRLYHEIDAITGQMRGNASREDLDKALAVFNDLAAEYSGRKGKIMHMALNFDSKVDEYGGRGFKGRGKSILDALEVDASFEKIIEDVDYMETLWSDILGERFSNLQSAISSEILLLKPPQKRGLF